MSRTACFSSPPATRPWKLALRQSRRRFRLQREHQLRRSDRLLLEQPPSPRTADDHLHFFCVRGTNRTNTASFNSVRVVIRVIEVSLSPTDDQACRPAPTAKNWSGLISKASGSRHATRLTGVGWIRRPALIPRIAAQPPSWTSWTTASGFASGRWTPSAIPAMPSSWSAALPPCRPENGEGNRQSRPCSYRLVRQLIGGGGLIAWISLKKQRQAAPGIDPKPGRPPKSQTEAEEEAAKKG